MLNQFSVPAACVPIAYDASAMYRGPPDESVQWLKSGRRALVNNRSGFSRVTNTSGSEYDALTQQLNGVILIVCTHTMLAAKAPPQKKKY